ncbi:MAG: hypothetical protein ABSB01_19495 [Streptosporangiaceae bacterium]|jgi:hypothetical protein
MATGTSYQGWPVADKAIREPASSTAAFQAGTGENQAITGLGTIGRRTACASLTSKS